jgi:hypothetical protein
VLGYGLDDRGSRFRFPAGAGNFSLHHRVQNGSGAHPASYPRGTGSSFPGGKAAGVWSWALTSGYLYLHLLTALKMKLFARILNCIFPLQAKYRIIWTLGSTTAIWRLPTRRAPCFVFVQLTPHKDGQLLRKRREGFITAYEGVSKRFRTESTLTFGVTRREATQRVMATKLTRLTHKITIILHLVAESCTICSSRFRRPVRKLLDTPADNTSSRSMRQSIQ